MSTKQALRHLHELILLGYRVGHSFCLTLLLLAFYPANSQVDDDALLNNMQPTDTILSEIQLTDTIDLTRAGLWQIDDYKIYVELKSIEEYLTLNYESMIRNNETTVFTDSVYQKRCVQYAELHKTALDQVQQAENGFDLRNLKLYFWMDKVDSKTQSHDIEMVVRQAVLSGQAAVIYQDKRIFKLKTLVVADYVMSCIAIYADHQDYPMYKYIGHIHW
ncbi:MAG: hypothetical protein GC193_01920 [Cryomorphaceae bacterium]|nr:hypothetical protein [Cryomorphaceae bacterium]